jgi:DNA-binding GntR family transcriptional regulator
MRRDIQQGQQTLEGLKNMPEKTLAATYGFSRETARKALTAVKSEMSSGSQSQL